jgi:hypothetical protein
MINVLGIMVIVFLILNYTMAMKTDTKKMLLAYFIS